MKPIILCSILLLTACNVEQEQCNTVYGYSTDQVNAAGLVLKSTDDAYVTFGQMGQFYNDMEKCTGLTALPPSIIYADFEKLHIGGAWGVYDYSTQTVLIDTNETYNIRNCKSDTATLKHEYIHHILYLNGRDSSHTNPAFAHCGATGVNTNNGVPY
jgi:hypothetical protein